MQNKKNQLIVALIIIIVLLLVYFVFLKRENTGQNANEQASNYDTQSIIQNKLDSPTSESKNRNNQKISSWAYTNASGVVIAYDSSWKAEPSYYGSAASSGKKELSGYTFKFPNGTIIVWGGPQSACNSNEFGGFEYGISKIACIKGLRADLHAKNVTTGISTEPSQADKISFGDFVNKNQ